jgi:hypothetical protein
MAVPNLAVCEKSRKFSTPKALRLGAAKTVKPCDRAAVSLPPQPSTCRDRRPEAELWAAFEAERPRILGVLLDAVVQGLKRLNTAKRAKSEIWLPFLDTYRTMCLAPQPDFRRVLKDVRAMQLAA